MQSLFSAREVLERAEKQLAIDRKVQRKYLDKFGLTLP